MPGLGEQSEQRHCEHARRAPRPSGRRGRRHSLRSEELEQWGEHPTRHPGLAGSQAGSPEANPGLWTWNRHGRSGATPSLAASPPLGLACVSLASVHTGWPFSLKEGKELIDRRGRDTEVRACPPALPTCVCVGGAVCYLKYLSTCVSHDLTHLSDRKEDCAPWRGSRQRRAPWPQP